MPPSQLKKLKASLREQGIVGPQQSKKQKKQNAQNSAHKEKRVHRTEALHTIRDQFNPFEYKWSKGPKFDVTTNRNIGGGTDSKIVGRPYVAKSRAEENVQKSLLHDRQNRNKVGGIMDRRFGENDPTMDPEAKMLERFTQEAQRRNKHSAFDLEDDEAGELTHMGQSLSLNGPAIKDDFEEDLSEEDEHSSEDETKSRKRRRLYNDEDAEEEDNGENSGPERKKSKQEVMKELIAKSKLHKYERQAAKDDDEDLREELDKELSDIHTLLRGMAPRPGPEPVAGIPGMNPDRAALLNGADKTKIDKDYDLRLRQMAQDKRSQPTERTKTEDEIAQETARKLQELETKRLRRMHGEPGSSDEEDEVEIDVKEQDEEDDFGFGTGIKARPATDELGAEDEDDFLIDDDLVASDSDLGISEDDSSDEVSDNEDEGEDSEFFKGLLTEEEARRPEFLTGANTPLREVRLPEKNGVNGNLAYKFKCPQSHEELVEITEGIAMQDLPTVVQRIRLQYSAKLKSENKAKLGNFAVALVDHISYLAEQPNPPPFSVLETIIRHIHSMARTSYPIEISNAFRRHLEDIHESRPLSLRAGDLVILTAIGNIFPTSDHFHQVVTPAILTMGRYLGLKIPQALSDYAMGAYLSTLCLQYQRFSKRYVPEVMNFIANTLYALAPTKMLKPSGSFPYHESKIPARIDDIGAPVRRLTFYDCVPQDLLDVDETSLKIALLETNLKLVEAAADTWNGKSAFFEVFQPVLSIAQHFGTKGCRSKLPKSTQSTVNKLAEKLNVQLRLAQLSRRPLELHHHKPLAIKMSIPKFEDSFNPDKHYDPDRERTEASKLKQEYKRERKGAIRELRKDAKVVARESLKEKKEKDAAYEKKYKRLVAEIQGEEGKEAKAYEREKEWRKKGRK